MKLNLDDLAQGVTKVIPVIARADDGTRLNLTGLTGNAITWKMAPLPGSPNTNPTISLAIGTGITITNAAQGEFTITIAASLLNQNVFWWFVHQCLLTLGGIVFQPLYGNAYVSQSIGIPS